MPQHCQVSIRSIDPLCRFFLLWVCLTLASACSSSTLTSPNPTTNKCAISVTPGTAAVGAQGGEVALTVTAQPECAWTVAPDAGWLTVAPSSGQGPAQVSIAIAPSVQLTARRANVQIGASISVITQEAAACQFDVTPLTQSVGAAGGSGTATITTSAACAWTATSNVPWLAIGASSASGSGDRDVTYTVAANTGGARSGTLTIAGRTVTIAQAAAAPCVYALSALSQNVAASGGPAVAVAVDTTPTCVWTAVSNAPWIAVSSGATGTGPGAVSLTVQANTGAQRTGTVTLGGQSHTVIQAAAGCPFDIAPASSTGVDAAGAANIAVTVTGPAHCSWTTTSNNPWITVSTGTSGNGNGNVTLSVAANPAAQRTGSATIAGRTHTVTQAAAPCGFAINPASTTGVNAAGATGLNINVTAAGHCSWTAIANDAWMTVTAGASGAGNGNVVLSVAANGSTERTGTVAIAGQTYSLTQSAAPAPCTYGLNPTGAMVAAGGATGSTVAVTAAGGCAWTAIASPSAPWITVTGGASGTANGTVTYSVLANTEPARSGVITVAGTAFTVDQASGCTYAVNPPTVLLPNSSASGQQIAVTTGTGCTCSAIASPSWITVTVGTPGNGPATITYSVEEYTGGVLNRQGTITVNGQTVTITQQP